MLLNILWVDITELVNRQKSWKVSYLNHDYSNCKYKLVNCGWHVGNALGLCVDISWCWCWCWCWCWSWCWWRAELISEPIGNRTLIHLSADPVQNHSLVGSTATQRLYTHSVTSMTTDDSGKFPWRMPLGFWHSRCFSWNYSLRSAIWWPW